MTFSRMPSAARRSVLLALSAVAVWQALTLVSLAQEGSFAPHKSWAFLAGYGRSFAGWGETSQDVEALDLVPRYSFLTHEDIGSGWYRGNHSTLIELPVHLVTHPDDSCMVGINFLACYTFTAGGSLRPYLFGGGGPVYSFADIPEMGSRFNGNYQFGIGISFDLTNTRALIFETRYHHISNGGIKEPNDPLNSIRVLMGIAF